jgi:hypothetical protein
VPITVFGSKQTAAYLQALREAAIQVAGTTVLVGSRLPYAYGIDKGRHRVSGKLARKAGGAQFLERAVEQALPASGPDVVRALEQYPTRKTTILRWVARPVVLLARKLAPVGQIKDKRSAQVRRSAHPGKPGKYRKAGALRRSIHVEVTRRRGLLP